MKGDQVDGGFVYYNTEPTADGDQQKYTINPEPEIEPVTPRFRASRLVMVVVPILCIMILLCLCFLIFCVLVTILSAQNEHILTDVKIFGVIDVPVKKFSYDMPNSLFGPCKKVQTAASIAN